MRAQINDLLRWWVGIWLVALGLLLRPFHRRKISRFARTQSKLREDYEIGTDTPIAGYPGQIESIEAFASSVDGVQFALTSGSTNKPKRIAYPPRRVRSVKWTYIDVFARCYAAYRFRRKALYVFSALASDDSLTGMMLAEKGLPPYLSGLQAPYRVQRHPALKAAVDSYGPSAVRLWVMAIANPGVLYSTNPSTLAAFLDDIHQDWDRTRALVRTFVAEPESLDPAIRKIEKRIRSVGSASRLADIASSPSPPPIGSMFPDLEAYSCWTGGYVAPFVARVEGYLAPQDYLRIPMYSMSTETVETISDFGQCSSGGSVRFVPVAPGVLYELLPEGHPDDAAALIDPTDAKVGQAYTLVVSDPYGLRRYQTEDLFECRGHVAGVPDLWFQRRRALEYSFTGEKITATQVESVFDTLRKEWPELADAAFMCVVPSDDPAPHYKLVVTHSTPPAGLGERFDRLLGAENGEYADKRASKRLGAPEVVQAELSEIAKRMRAGDDWESQFKFLPLYRKTWD